MLKSHTTNALSQILLPLILTMTFTIPGIICLPDEMPLPGWLPNIGSFCLERVKISQEGQEEGILHLHPTRGRTVTHEQVITTIKFREHTKLGDGQPVIFHFLDKRLFWAIKIPSSDGVKINPDLAPQIKREAEFYARLNGYNNAGVTLPHSTVLALFLDDFEETMIVKDPGTTRPPVDLSLVRKISRYNHRTKSQSGSSEDSEVEESEGSDHNAENRQSDESEMPTQYDKPFPFLVFPTCERMYSLKTQVCLARKHSPVGRLKITRILLQKLDELFDSYHERGIRANHEVQDLAVCKNQNGETTNIIPLNLSNAVNMDMIPPGSPSRKYCEENDKYSFRNKFEAAYEKDPICQIFKIRVAREAFRNACEEIGRLESCYNR